jgi:hypothetical protein
MMIENILFGRLYDGMITPPVITFIDELPDIRMDYNSIHHGFVPGTLLSYLSYILNNFNQFDINDLHRESDSLAYVLLFYMNILFNVNNTNDIPIVLHDSLISMYQIYLTELPNIINTINPITQLGQFQIAFFNQRIATLERILNTSSP